MPHTENPPFHVSRPDEITFRIVMLIYAGIAASMIYYGFINVILQGISGPSGLGTEFISGQSQTNCTCCCSRSQ